MEEIIVIILLILFNGIFSMSEIAVISARKVTLSNEEKRGSKAARTALKLADNPSRFLSTIQIGITLIGIVTGIYSGAALSGKFASLLEGIGVPMAWAYPIAQTLIVLVVTYLTIIFGELVPKRIGMSMAEKMAKTIARPMYLLSRIAGPFVWILSISTEGVIKMLGIKESDNKVTEEDIKSIVQEGKEDGEVQEVEQDIVERVFMMGDLKVSSLMTHRSELVSLDVNMTNEDIKKVFSENLYEAYPVIDRGMDNVLGVVSLKDLILRLDDKQLDLRKIMRPATYFYENMNVYKALEQMKEKRLSQAFICDEFGSFEGIITLRDILEGLVGSIDGVNNEPEIIKRDDSESWLVDGQCSFYDFLSHFDREDLYDNTQNYTTLAGLVIEQMKHIPQSGERTSWQCFNLEIVDMDGARIDKVLVTLKKDDEDKE
ncbi:MAG: hemolysin family protein [Prevotellaceae bacterium]|nr:hemolysin family protein [Prevotellaceae bacterium]